MRTVRYILWAVVAVVAIAMAYVVGFEKLSGQGPNNANIKLGGEFNLVRHDGKPISGKDLLGKPHAIFFGFTSCPEVCPTTLFEITTWLEKLGPDADKLNVYFMSVDPERDTVQVLGEYLSAFDNRIIGITGERKKVEETLRSYKVFFKRVELEDDDYTMDHTATIFLLNAKGEFVRSIAYGENGETAVAKLRLMLN